MIQNLRQRAPNACLIAQAGILGAAAYLLINIDVAASDQSHWLRVAYATAFALLMSDVIAGADIGRGTDRSYKNPHTWVFAFYMGYFWAVLMILFQWDGLPFASTLFLTWGIAGVFFGLVMAHGWAGTEQKPADARYDLDRPMTGRTLGWLYFAWPVIICGAMAVLVSVADSLTEEYLLFQLVLLGWLVPLYSVKAGRFYVNLLPRLLGSVLLVTALFTL